MKDKILNTYYSVWAETAEHPFIIIDCWREDQLDRAFRQYNQFKDEYDQYIEEYGYARYERPQICKHDVYNEDGDCWVTELDQD